MKNVLPQLGEVYEGIEMRLDDAAWVGHRLAEILPIPLADKQVCLELDDPIQRLDVLGSLGVAATQAQARREPQRGGDGGAPRQQPVAQ